MILPDYHDGSIVNLMQSIVAGLGDGDRSHDYAPLTLAAPEIFADSGKVVLFVIDGLGHEFLLETAGGGAMHGHLRGRLTSASKIHHSKEVEG